MADQLTVLPAIYFVIAAVLEIQLLRQKPQSTWPERIVALFPVSASFSVGFFQAIERNG